MILIDDENRENEGDFFVAGEKVTPEIINFFATVGRGLVCAPVAPEVAARLNFHAQTARPDENVCNFTVSVDAKNGVSTGISAADRAQTIAEICRENSRPADFARPGHIFPIVAKPGGVRQRAGHTEAAIELCRLADFKPVGTICEICNADGSMARGENLEKIAAENNLKIGTIENLVEFLDAENLIPPPAGSNLKVISAAKLPTEFGEFEIQIVREIFSQKEHSVLFFESLKKFQNAQNPPVRFHSKCTTGDVFGSKFCDCRAQLEKSFEKIAEEKSGAIVYLNEEGRGIGLGNKIAAYKIQQKNGCDTFTANEKLNFSADERDFFLPVKIARLLNFPKNLRILTNNPEKISTFKNSGFEIERESLEIAPGKFSAKYLAAKKARGHFLENNFPE